MAGIEHNILFKVACGSMLTALTMGAKYGHAGKLDQDGATLFSKGQLYNLSNVVGLIACSLVSSTGLTATIAAGGFILGQLMFVSPIFYQAVKGKDSSLRLIVPLGGTCMMVAWASLIFA